MGGSQRHVVDACRTMPYPSEQVIPLPYGHERHAVVDAAVEVEALSGGGIPGRSCCSYSWGRSHNMLLRTPRPLNRNEGFRIETSCLSHLSELHDYCPNFITGERPPNMPCGT